MGTPNKGNSAVFGPDGRCLTKPLEGEGLVYADLDLGQVTKAKTFADATGHYSRPDLLWLGADSREKSFITSQVKESSTAKGKKVEDELVDGEANGSA